MKRYIKSSVRFYHEWEVEAEFEDGFTIQVGGGSERAAFDNLFSMVDKLSEEHGELVWYGYSNDEHYYDGQYIVEDEFTNEENWL